MEPAGGVPAGVLDDRRIPAGVWRVAVVTVLGTIMAALDTTIVNVALATLSRDVHTSIDSVQWLVSGYLLAYAATMPVTGWAARRFGTKRVFMVSIVTFTLGSLLCGLSTSLGEMIAFRVVQGVGAGLITPVGQMIVVKKAGPARLPRVMGAIGVPIMLAPVVGPTVGGLLLQSAGWRWIFFINLPVGVVALVAAARLLPRDRREDAGPLDLAGLGLATSGLVGVTYALANLDTAGFVSTKVLLPLAVGLVLVAAFALRALHIERPLLDVKLFANRAFGAASLTAFCTGAALFGSMILMPLYFQLVRGEDAVTTGLLLIPSSIGSTAGVWASGRAMERFGPGITALSGGVISVVSSIPFVLIGAHTPYSVLSAAMVIRGVGSGMSVMPAMTAGYQALRPEQVNDGAPQLNALQRVGGSLGTAASAVVLQHELSRAGPLPAAQAAAFGTTFWWLLVLTAVATLPTILLIKVQRRSAASVATAPSADDPMADSTSGRPAEAILEGA
jgi:EmrB/QacA subfamily drug resistance transporter